MKTIIFTLTLLITTSTWAKIVYVDNHDDFISPNGNNIDYMKIDIDKDNSTDISFYITQTNVSCVGQGSMVSKPYLYCVSGDVDNKILPKDCNKDTINHFDFFTSTDYIISTGLFPNSICSGKTSGSYKLGFRLTRKNLSAGKNGFLYGYIEYSLTTSGDIVVHGWYYNDTFNEPIIANSSIKYPYNGCLYQDTIKTHITINDTIKTCLEIVTKYDTIKTHITINDTIHKIIYDTTKITFHDTIHKTIYDTIKTHVTINDTIHKTIYTNVKVKVYDTINVPIAVTDTLIIKLNNTKETQIRIWPNPTQQSITIDRSDNKDVDIIIIDQNGKTLVNMKTNTQILQLDVSQWSVGTYTLIIKQNENTITKHLQIIR